MTENKILMVDALQDALQRTLMQLAPDRVFILTDENTRRLCWPQIMPDESQPSTTCNLSHKGEVQPSTTHNLSHKSEAQPSTTRNAADGRELLRTATHITIQSGDAHKDLTTLTQVWTTLSEQHATRHSCLLNVGGGMVTDLGGFAASTFKRGIAFVNLPTTLLAMIDASVGGKTGINFMGLKNEIGAFCEPRAVLIDSTFLKTLDARNLRSGYAEMLKHALIAQPDRLHALLAFDLERPNLYALQALIAESIAVKARIVAQDPHEQQLRKVLNFGHTIGHAFESFAMRRTPILHGYAVAYGMICELYLSHVKCGFPLRELQVAVQFIREHYGRLLITCDDYDELLQWMQHDKKNTQNHIRFTLLRAAGDYLLDQTATNEEIKSALDFFRET